MLPLATVKLTVYLTEPSLSVVGALRLPRVTPVGTVMSLASKPETASLKTMITLPLSALILAFGRRVSICVVTAENGRPELPD